MLHVLSLPLLAPVLLWQGKQVRQNTVRLPEPEGARSGKQGAGPSLSILIVGDSSAAGVGASHQQHALGQQVAWQLARHFDVNWTLHAKSGVNTADALEMLEQLPRQSFDVVVTVLGVNDVTSRLAVKSWLAQQQRLRAILAARFAAQRIIVCGMPPMGHFPALPQPLRWYLGRRAIQFEKQLRQQIESEPCASFLALDFSNDVSLMAEDGFHPGPGVYSKWAEALAKKIAELQVTD